MREGKVGTGKLYHLARLHSWGLVNQGPNSLPRKRNRVSGTFYEFPAPFQHLELSYGQVLN